jgi:hypothetical protein
MLDCPSLMSSKATSQVGPELGIVKILGDAAGEIEIPVVGSAIAETSLARKRSVVRGGHN